MKKVLMLEDNPYDLGLILNKLKKDNLEFLHKHTDNKIEFIKELNSFKPDIILADYKLPDFSGLEALEIVKQKDPDIPVIFVSGTIGEEKAVEAMKNGLSDYILKDNLHRLSVAINREIKEAEIRRKKKIAEEELIKAKEKAEESDRLKSMFLANMSHEIRTPMNGIIGFTDMLTKNDLSKEEKVLYTEIIKDSTNQLLHIINDILDLSRIEVHQLKIERKFFNIDKLMIELYHEFELLKNKNNKQNIRILLQKENYDNNFQVYSDESRLRQILTNLINNALKFTEKGFIEFGFKIENNEEIIIYVKDTGIGISQENQKFVFERFRQVDESNSKIYGGSGLGLSIVKGLVKLLNGKIWLNSTIEKGSTFHVSIPTETNTITNCERKEDISIDYKFKDKTVLIVEDEEINILFFKEIFKETELDCIYTNYGYKAIDLVKTNSNIDIVLMDIKLPDLDGFTATKIIKQHRNELPVIAQTAFAFVEDRTECLVAGCDDYISKPINKEELFNKINLQLNKKAVTTF